MDNNWSDAVKRLIGNELLPCPICGMSPDISCEGKFLSHDLYSVGCYHTGNSGDYLPLTPLTTPLSSEFSDCIRMWNNLAEDYYKSMINFNSFVKSEIELTNQQEENLHDSFMEFLRSN